MTSEIIPFSAIERGLYIDFEGTKNDPPSFLGWYCEGEWGFYVTEEVMYPAVDYPNPKGKGQATDLENACRFIMGRALEEERQIFAWSSRELAAILELECWSAPEVDWWNKTLINALPLGKRWAKRTRTAIPAIPGQGPGRLNKWSLSGFRIATGYLPVHAIHEPGHTATRLRHVRHQLATRNGDFSRLTRVAKGKWTKVLTHNYHDCVGLAHVMRVVHQPT